HDRSFLLCVILIFFSMPLRPPSSTLFPYTTLFRSILRGKFGHGGDGPPWTELCSRVKHQRNRCTSTGGHTHVAHRFRWCFTRERSEEHTSELQSRGHLVCRLLLEKKKNRYNAHSVG